MAYGCQISGSIAVGGFGSFEVRKNGNTICTAGHINGALEAAEASQYVYRSKPALTVGEVGYW